MNRTKTLSVLGLALLLASCTGTKQNPYEDKVNHLVAEMTLQEKIDQMIFDAPYNERLGIPAMMHGECLHGLVYPGATNFPQAIALGSTWDPALIKQTSECIAKEARAVGITHCYSPNLDVSIGNPRNGRTEESYAEDPYLVTQIGVAFIKGLQGEGKERFDKNHIIATAKHFVAYSESRTGRNGDFVDVSMRRLKEIHFPPFIAAVKEAKVGAIMPAHQDLNGVPCHMNKWLLDDVLRKEWGFDGFIVSDNIDVSRLHTIHKVSENRTQSSVLGLEAGVDLDLVLGKKEKHKSYCMNLLKDTVAKNPEILKLIDRSVKRLLTAKYELGLFDQKQDDAQQPEVVSTPEAQELALKVAEKAVILLKNENNILPLDKKKIKSIAVIGPNAGEELHPTLKNHIVQSGDYSDMPPYYTSVVEGIQAKVGKGVKVNYAEGCSLVDENRNTIDDAVRAARQSDVVIMAVGENTMICGEGRDRDNVNFYGRQTELINKVAATGKPIVMVLLGGRQLCIEEEAKKVNAIIEGWYLGMRTGDALANVIFGDVNPGGKLTVTFPRNIGQLPKSYLTKPKFTGQGHGNFFKSTDEPLFAFGYGLSYTTFEYSNIALSADRIKAGQPVEVTLDLKNTGNYDGDEVVQVYVTDDVASVGRYDKLLKAFKRVSVKKGETKKVTLTLAPESFEMFDVNLNKVIEPGSFTIHVGASSRAQDLTTKKLYIE